MRIAGLLGSMTKEGYIQKAFCTRETRIHLHHSLNIAIIIPEHSDR